MNKLDYGSLLINTLDNFFNGEDRKRIISKLKGQKIIVTTKNSNNKDSNILDCSGLDNKNTLEMSIKNREISSKIIEDYEFEKPYKYSAIFDYANFSKEIINKLIEENNVILYNDNQVNDFVENVIAKPTVKFLDDKIIFKFSMNKKSNRQSEENICIKYTIVAIFFTKHNVLEIRLDNLSDRFKQNKDFYSLQIRSVLSWVNKYLDVSLININCREIIDNIIKNHSDEVKVYQQTICTKYDAKANLKVADNGSFILPILGDLITLVDTNKEEFEKEECKTVYGLLQDFIKEIEDTSDFPKVTLCWYKKSMDFIVEFTHGFYGNGFSMLQHYGRSQDMEGMNYVTEYIITNRTMDM